VSKDKKKKKKSAKGSSGSSTLKSLANNPMVADIVATALVATAAALKDSKRARALATGAGDELAKLSKAGAKSGGALWDMALQIGKRSLDELVGSTKAAEAPKAPNAPKAPRAPKAPKAPKAKASKATPKASSTKKPASAGRKK
jgi:hypothetical protein